MLRSRKTALVVAAAAAQAVGVSAVAAWATPERPPVIVIKAPKDGSVTHDQTVTVEGTVTVHQDTPPGQNVTATLNGKSLPLNVQSALKYTFKASVDLKKGSNEITVGANDAMGGESSQSVTVKYVPPAPVKPTARQCVDDRGGDSHDNFTHMDIVSACAQRRGGKVIFSVTTAHRPPHVHDGFGNPAAPCLEYSKGEKVEPHITPIQTCGDANLRGWTMHHWPKVPFSISGKVSKWKVPLKYLSKSSFQWRAYVADGWNYADKAPDKGYLTFVVK
jgi:hypothetical protein